MKIIDKEILVCFNAYNYENRPNDFKTQCTLKCAIHHSTTAT